MSILVDDTTRVLVQGITGREGAFHAEQMSGYGTRVVAGVTPGKYGRRVCDGRIPVFDTVLEAVQETGATTSVVFVPAPFAADAILEAADAGLALVVCITEGTPVLDMVRVRAFLAQEGTTRLIGPNCPGVITPGKAKVGIIPGSIVEPGSVGVVSRSGTLTYEIVNSLTKHGFGQSTCVGIGGDAVIGTGFVDVLGLFEADPGTDQIVLIGEIGGAEEQAAARFVAEHMSKPVVAFVAGVSAPAGTRMGHAGAIIEGGTGSAAEKIEALLSAGVLVAQYPDEIADLVVQHGKNA